MGRITVILNRSTIQDIPKEEGIFAIFYKSTESEECPVCLKVKSTGNLFGNVRSYISNNLDINQLLVSGISILVIYETLANIETVDLRDKEEEWKSIYKPEKWNLPENIEKVYV